MARNSYDMDDNMKNSGSETYDKTKNQSRNVRRITVRTVRRTVLRTLRTMGETAKDKKDAAV